MEEAKTVMVSVDGASVPVRVRGRHGVEGRYLVVANGALMGVRTDRTAALFSAQSYLSVGDTVHVYEVCRSEAERLTPRLSNLARTALSGAAGHGVLAEGMRKAVGK